LLFGFIHGDVRGFNQALGILGVLRVQGDTDAWGDEVDDDVAMGKGLAEIVEQSLGQFYCGITVGFWQ
jgi:hypothetical protein